LSIAPRIITTHFNARSSSRGSGSSAWRKAIASPFWAWLGAAVVGVAYITATSERRFVGAIVSASVFALVQSLLPGCRPVTITPLCPWNWALFLFGLQLVILPFSVLVTGPSLGVLPHLPSDTSINLAMVIGAIAFVSFAVTYEVLGRRSRIAKRTVDLPSTQRNLARSETARRLAPKYLLLGGTGLFLAFGSIGSFLNYFEDPAKYLDLFSFAAHTLAGVSSLFLRPFLGFGLVMLWCDWVDGNSGDALTRKSVFIAAVTTLAAMLGVIVSYATFSYNRGAFVVPLISMLAVLLARGRRVSFGVIAIAGSVLVAVLLLAPFYAVFRNSDLTGNRTAAELLEDPAITDFFADKIDLVDTLQMYASGPQYLGYVLEESHWGAKPYLGSTLFPSIVEPMPVIGRTLAESSGPMIYNQMIYGTSEIFDQIFPFASEMFLNFNIFGVIAGFCFLSLIAFWLQRNFEQARSALEVYIWQYVAVWVLFLIMGSISVVTQTLFYFCWPIYLFFYCSRRATRAPKGRQQWQPQS
jgi:hypothetical protein